MHGYSLNKLWNNFDLAGILPGRAEEIPNIGSKYKTIPSKDELSRIIECSDILQKGFV